MAATLIFNSFPLPPNLASRHSNPIPISSSHLRSLSIAPFPRNPHNRSPIPAVGFAVAGMLPLRSGAKGFDFASRRAASDIGSGSGGGGGDGGGGSGDGGGTGGGDGNDGDDWSLLKWYMMCLDCNSVLTKSLTTALLNLIGDLICQLLIDKVSKLDVKRTSMFTFLGFVLVGPTLHFWYLSLSKLVTWPGASGTFLRLLLDQFIFSPIFIGVFLSALLTLEGRPSLIRPKLEQEWFPSVLANWQLWIPFQFLNFQFVPQQFQVLAANVVALAWNVILSFKAHKEIVVK